MAPFQRNAIGARTRPVYGGVASLEPGSWHETCRAMARYSQPAYLQKERNPLSL